MSPISPCSHVGCGPEGILTLSASVIGLLAFSSKAIPILISITTPKLPTNGFLRVVRLRDEILSVTAHLQMLQPFLSHPHWKPLDLQSLLAIITGCVKIYSEIEEVLSKARGRSYKLVPAITGFFAKRRTTSITQRLRTYEMLLSMVVDVLHCEDVPNPEEQVTIWNQMSEDILSCKQCLKGINRCHKCHLPIATSSPEAQPPARPRYPVDLSRHAELSLPIRLSEVFNSAWYKATSQDASPDGEDSILDALLRNTAKLANDYPFPGSLGTAAQMVSWPSSMKEQFKVNSAIEGFLRSSAMEKAGEKQILLLGGDMDTQILHSRLKDQAASIHSIRDRYKFIPEIFNLLLHELQLSVRRVEQDGGFYDTETKLWVIHLLQQNSIYPGRPFPVCCLPMFKILWSTQVQSALENESDPETCKAVQYFFGDIDRLFRRHYLPTDDDVQIFLLCFRSPGSNATMKELPFCVNSNRYRFLHLGHVGDRMKIVQHFTQIDAVLFVVDISRHDETITGEFFTESLLMEQRVHFDSIVNSRYFANSKIILLFTNVDRFREKIRLFGGWATKKLYADMKFEGQENDPEDWLRFFTDLFMGSARREGRERDGCAVEYTWEKDRDILKKIDGCFEMLEEGGRIKE